MFVGNNVKKFADKIIKVIKNKETMYKGYSVLAPEGDDGLDKAVTLIEACV